MAARDVPRNRPKSRRGAVVVLVAIAGTVVVGMGALTIDVGNMYIVRTEMQRTADASALSAVPKLAKYRRGSSEASAIAEAQRIAAGNPVDNKTTLLDPARDVEFGQALWDATRARYTFQPGGTVPNAVRVSVRKTKDSPNGSLPLFFANFYGSDVSMQIKAAAMLAPRDIAIVSDMSRSMSSDSQLTNYRTNPINLWTIWVCLPIEKGNNGVGNGIDPAPPGLPPLNDGYGTAPGDPGNRGGADPKTDPGLMGPTWGRMATWGTLEITTSYDPTIDEGLEHLGYGQNWSENTDLRQWYQAIGYNPHEINALLSGQFDQAGYWKYRVAVALGFARWDSGKNGGLWSLLPDHYIKSTRGNANDKVEPGELAWLVSFPYKDGSKSSDMAYWLDYIDNYMRSANTLMYQANADFSCRFGLKTFVNYLLESWGSYSQCPDLYKTPEQPLQSLKNAVTGYLGQLIANQVDDHMSLEVYGTTAHNETYLTKQLGDVSGRLRQMQAIYYDPNVNMADGIYQAIQELTGTRARGNATKAIFLVSASQPDATGTGAGAYAAEQYVLQQVQAALARHIQIHCISVGIHANRALMQQIASIAGTTEYFAGPTITEYSSTLPQIFSDLDVKRGPRLIE